MQEFRLTLSASGGGCRCRAHWDALCREYPPDLSSPENFYLWTVNIAHTKVRERLKQSPFTTEQADARWRKPNWNFFHRVIVLNMPHDTVRLEDFWKRFPAKDWPFKPPTVFEALKGREVSAPEGWKFTSNINHGTLGCRASWLAVLKWAIDTKVQKPILVMEDDCQFVDGAAEKIQALLPTLPPDWQILYLGGQHDRPPMRVSESLAQCVQTGRTHCLAIHPSFFQELYAFWSSYMAHVDWGLREIAATHRFYAIDPFVAGQGINFSTLRNRLEPARTWDSRTSIANDPAAIHTTEFCHAGDVGDILAALPTLRAASRPDKGKLTIFPSNGTRQRMSLEIVESLASLLRTQPYIGEVVFSQKPEGIALDGWRKKSHPTPYSLADRTLDLIRAPHGERNTPWLTVEPRKVSRVIFARSPRYRNSNFPWHRVVSVLGKDAIFLGFKEECEEFNSTFKCDIPWFPTGNYLELARVVAGAELVCVNQTSIFWVAEALKKNIIQEQTPDRHNWNCHHERPGLIAVLKGNEPIERLLRAAVQPVTVELGIPLSRRA